MKIIFFGAGAFAKNVWETIHSNLQLYVDEYIAFADNNSELWGTEFCKREVIAPADIHNYNPDLIVITSIYEKAIKAQLIESLGVDPEKIYSFWDYERKCYAGWNYRKRYGSDERKTSAAETGGPVVVYTAITGDYDSLKDPLFKAGNLAYVCFTNNRQLKSNIWNMEYIDNHDMDNVYLARHIKMNPHLYFSDYDTSIWVDGKYQIMDDLRTYVVQYQKQSPVLCFPHPHRDCICDEAAVCIMNHLDKKERMFFQVSDYLRKGFPLNYGLYETGCMVRIHNDISVKMLMGKWEKEITRYSIRDQLSFPYVCWESGFVPDICNLDINRNPWLLQRRNLY